MGALGLLFVLHTQALTGSTPAAASSRVPTRWRSASRTRPWPGWSTRRGQTLVLLVGAPVSAAAMAAAALLPAGAATEWLAVCAVVAGAFQPPVGACMRALWPVLLADADQRHVAYATEGALLEVVYICGPLAIVGGIGSWSLEGALAACAAFTLAGDLAFASARASRRWRPAADRHRDAAWGAAPAAGVRVLIAVFALCGLAIGAVEVCVPAALDCHGSPRTDRRAAGVLGRRLDAGRLAVARSRAPRDAPRRLSILLALWGLGHAALALAGSPPTLALLLVLAGATIAPTLVCANGMLDGLAPAGP
jgi:hypothetical protein